MSESCQVMTTELATARTQMQGLLEKTSKIKRERSVLFMSTTKNYHIPPAKVLAS